MPRRPAVLLACLLAPAAAHAGDGLSGSITLTSDYVFRGVSQTLGGPAVQGVLRYDHGTGVYASAAASNVDYGAGSGVRREYAGTVGVARDFGAVSIDIGHAYTLYPGAEPGGSLDYGEWLLEAGMGERWTLSAGWSGDVFATGRTGTWSQVGYSHPLGDHLALHAAVGTYRLGGDLADYRHAQLGAAWAQGPWEARVVLHAASAGARRNFGDDVARHRVEAALVYGF